MNRKTRLPLGLGLALLLAASLAWHRTTERGAASIPALTPAARPDRALAELQGSELAAPEADTATPGRNPSRADETTAALAPQTLAPRVELTAEAKLLLERAAEDVAEFEAVSQMADLPDQRASGDREFLENVERIQIEDQLELSELGQQLHGAEQTASMLNKLSNWNSNASAND